MVTSALPNLRIFLVRHAHAAWAAPGIRDFDRPLDLRGKDEAERLAATMAINGYLPDLVYCSTARRCRETLDIVLSGLAISPRIERSETLYCSLQDTYLDVIGSNHGTHTTAVMIIGHNPMLEATALALLQNEPGVGEDVLGAGFPTAGLLVADCKYGETGPRPGNACPDVSFIALIPPTET